MLNDIRSAVSTAAQAPTQAARERNVYPGGSRELYELIKKGDVAGMRQELAKTGGLNAADYVCLRPRIIPRSCLSS